MEELGRARVLQDFRDRFLDAQGLQPFRFLQRKTAGMCTANRISFLRYHQSCQFFCLIPESPNVVVAIACVSPLVKRAEP